ncbi:PGF-pre-PGF domain-containing protein [Methanolobus sp. WCC5]|uniref:PGF-pre-PGF domain-containing protein n=1 Tax=Methanolobus sp. WCC5 TaxID=3125785 RepID=UPI00325219FF
MQTKNKVLITILLLLLFSTLNASGNADDNNIDDGSLLLLKAGYINTDNVPDPEERTNKSQTMTFATSSAIDEEKYYIVQFTGPVHNEWKQNVTSKGAFIYNYVPNNAFVFRMSEDVKDQVQALGSVKWVGEYSPSYKYDPALTDSGNIRISGYDPKDISKTYHVLLFSASDNEMIQDEIEAMGASVLSGSSNVLRIQSSPDKLHGIASMHGVRWIEEYILPTINNDIAADIISVSTVHETYGLKGKNQIIAVCDTGLDTGNESTIHADLRGRLLNITDVANDGSVADQNGHGTHVAGSVLGNGSLSGGQYSGMAPEAELVFQAVGGETNYLYPPANLCDLFQPAYDLGARIHTNSWGSSSNGAYTTYSQQIDQFMWENPDMLILFSAGNSGIDANSDGVIDQGSIGSPGTAKNCLTVGASENERGNEFGIVPYLNWGSGSWLSYYPENPIRDDYMASNREGMAAFSSRGPTEDGRIKPDVVAPGTFIASTRSSIGSSSGWGPINDNYLYMGGTSMSTPITAGTAALIRQYYVEVENLSNPSAALLKATFINGALDMTPGQYGTGDYQEISGRPDYSQGWGRIDIENSIYAQHPKVIKYFDNPQPLNLTSPPWNVSYDILYTSEPLRVTLVWTDYPGNEAADLQLVNNLDLIVRAPDGTYYGNNGPDTVNNIEVVELREPVGGTYTFTVTGTNVPEGPQNFSLVLSYGDPEIDIYPEHSSYTNNSMTAVFINLTHADGIGQDSINMTIDGSQVVHSLEDIDNGYRVENLTMQPYSEGYHNVSVSAMTGQNEQLSYGWRFYVSSQENRLSIHTPAENAVIQDNVPYLNISTSKLSDIWYNVNNGTNSTKENAFSLNRTLNLSEGRHSITVFAEYITGYINSSTVNFTVFTSQPIIESPDSGTIYYLPKNSIDLNGTTGIATNVSVYVNGIMTNDSWPVSDGVFNISSVPLFNGTNIVNVTSIFNNSADDHFSSNTSIYLSLGAVFNVSGSDEITIEVPGLGDTVNYPAFNFNVSGTSANPGNLSAAVVRAYEPGGGSCLGGPALDIRVLNSSDPDNSHPFGRNVTLSLGYYHSLVNSTEKLVLAWYNPDDQTWHPFRSTVNESLQTVSANITHLSIYAPVEDNTPPVISNLTNSSSSSSVTLSWEASGDTDHVEIWRNGNILGNYSGSQMTDTGLSASTGYNYGLRAVDFAGNIANWSNVTVITSKQLTVTSTPASSGGGGGGGGGGSTGEAAENIAFKDVVSIYVSADDMATFDFNSEKNDIEYIRYQSLKNSGRISTTIEILKNTSSFADSPAPGIIYSNINIWVGKTGYATGENIRDPVIGFRVGKEWILTNNIDPADISLKRYSDGKWKKLNTKQTLTDEKYLTDDKYLYFEAETPGFSPFAITADETFTKQTEEENVTISTELTGPSSEEDTSGTCINPDDDMGKVVTGRIPAISGLIAVLIFMIAFVIVRKQQN